MAMDVMAPLMFVGLIVFLLLGYPVAFALAANGIVFAFIGIELGMLGPELLQALPERIFGIMANQTLLAIPFFTFMGIVLERSGMAEDLLDTIGQFMVVRRGQGILEEQEGRIKAACETLEIQVAARTDELKRINTRPQIQMIGISQNDLSLNILFQLMKMNGLD